MKEYTVVNADGSSLKAVLDPSAHWKHVSPDDLINSLGLIPSFLSDERYSDLPTVECINKTYAHGGGWMPFEGFTMEADNSLSYPGDPWLHPLVYYVRTLASGVVEELYQYQFGWLAIANPLQVSRLD